MSGAAAVFGPQKGADAATVAVLESRLAAWATELDAAAGWEASAASGAGAAGGIGVAVLALGGTITGEHGVGRLKRPWLAEQLGPDVMALNQRVKAALDPLNILNPGSGI